MLDPSNDGFQFMSKLRYGPSMHVLFVTFIIIFFTSFTTQAQNHSNQKPSTAAGVDSSSKEFCSSSLTEDPDPQPCLDVNPTGNFLIRFNIEPDLKNIHHWDEKTFNAWIVSVNELFVEAKITFSSWPTRGRSADNHSVIEVMIDGQEGASCGEAINQQNKIMIHLGSCQLNHVSHIPSLLTHELGHIFGLLHTHHASGSTMSELVSRTERSPDRRLGCSVWGDKFCDTPADPNLKGVNLSSLPNQIFVDNQCRYTGNALDRSGKPFSPDTRNFMSYTLVACMDHFSKGTNQDP